MREEHAVSRARDWLRDVSLEPLDIERALLRLFALRAAELVSPDGGGTFIDLGSRLPTFAPGEYRGDPLLAIAVQRALHEHGIAHDGLFALVSVFAGALEVAPEAEMALVAILIRQSGFEVAAPLPEPKWTLPSEEELIAAERDQLLEVCRLVTTVTACGIRKFEWGEVMGRWLPGLCVSYAIDWDIEAVSVILRACAYLGVRQAAGCQWSRTWLLDQQQRDGRFGLLAHEAKRLGQEPGDWSLHFYPTVNALWTLAEIRQPGFLVT